MAKYVTIQVTPKEPAPGQQPEGERCKRCNTALEKGELKRSMRVCPHCSYHYPLPAHERVAQLADPGSATFIGEDLRAGDPLEFNDLKSYPDRMSEAQSKTGLTEAFLGDAVHHLRPSDGAGDLGLQFLGRFHGLCRRGEVLLAWPRPPSRIVAHLWS